MNAKTMKVLSDKLDEIFAPEFKRILINSAKKLGQKKFQSEIKELEQKDKYDGINMPKTFTSLLDAETKLTNENPPLDLTVHVKLEYYIEDNLCKKKQKKAKSSSKSKKPKLSLVKK
jgi:hypothetical protein